MEKDLGGNIFMGIKLKECVEIMC